MANWSYIGSPYTGLQKVRAMIGDTNPDDQIIADHEINAVLDVYTNEVKAAAYICRNLSAQFAVEGDVTVGKYKFENLKKAEYFKKLSESFFKESTGSATPFLVAGPSFGGISKSNKEANDANTDNVDPKFYRNQFADPDIEIEDDTE